MVAIVLGIAFGWIAPAQAVLLKPLSDGFIKVLRLMLPPIIFSTVAIGIGSAGDLRKIGRAGLKALIYFEAMTTLALIIGLVVVHVFKPGAGLNIDPSTLDSRNVAALAKTAEHLGIVDYLLGIIPTGVTAPFADNNILQVLFLGVLFGIALARIGTNADVLHRGFNQLSAVLFVVVGYLIRLAPIAAFAAMSFTIGKYGITTLASLFSPVGCFYVTSAVFVLVVLGLVCAGLGVNIFRFLAYFREELFVVLGTSASEPVLRR